MLVSTMLLGCIKVVPVPVPEEAQQVPQEELINQAAGIM